MNEKSFQDEIKSNFHPFKKGSKHKVNNTHTGKRCEICLKFTMQGIMSLLLTLNLFHVFLVFLLLTLSSKCLFVCLCFRSLDLF